MLKRLQRLRSPELDESGTDVAEDLETEEMEPDDTGEPEQVEQEPVEAGDETAEVEEELIVSLDGEPEEEEKAAPNWVKDLRKSDREKTKRIRELEAKLQGSAPVVDDLGKEPELEDFDYDADAFKSAYKDWTAKKVKADQRKEAERKQQEEVAKEWQAVQDSYVKGKSRFAKDKMQEAEDEVVSVLSNQRQAMLMDAADDSAALVLALGSSPNKLRELSAIKSDAKFIKELAKIEMNIKVQSKKTPPPPERTISGTGKTPGAGQANIDRLYEQAQKTGDFTAYYAAKNRK